LVALPAIALPVPPTLLAAPPSAAAPLVPFGAFGVPDDSEPHATIHAQTAANP
jgi:hypothetical protein